ncbi:MAG TPA: DUF4190 domain-containing protein [Candidatus Dormibacteraeota bacterium]|nr:DUF4190 domain-containing protein [Candidatus Dormibacteraeota bacterium]
MRTRAADLNVAALAAVVLAVLGWVGVLPVVGPALGIVLGEVARRQIARTGEAGSGIARAARILGAAWFVLAALALLLFSLWHTQHGS